MQAVEVRSCPPKGRLRLPSLFQKIWRQRYTPPHDAVMFERFMSEPYGRPRFQFNRAVVRRFAIFLASAATIIVLKLTLAPSWPAAPQAERVINIATAVAIFAVVRWIVQPGFSRRL